MPNTYEMDSIGPSNAAMQQVQARDMSAYETTGIADPQAKAYVEYIGNAVGANTYANNLRKSATTRSGGWNDRQLYDDNKAKASEYSQKAAAALESLDVNSISKNDYMQVIGAQCDSKRGVSFDDDIAFKLQCRHITANLDDKQMTSVLNNCSQKFKEEFIKETMQQHPELELPKETLDKQINEVKAKIADSDPRPDIKNPAAIDKAVLSITNETYDAHMKSEQARLDAHKNMSSPNLSRYENTGLPTVETPGGSNGMSL